MEKLLDALELYAEIQDLIKFGLEEEEIEGYIDFFYGNLKPNESVIN